MKSKLLFGFMLVLFGLQSEAQQLNPLLTQKLQDTLDYLVSNNANTKGVSACVYIPGQGIWQGTSGISHNGFPMSSDMVMPLASNTKLFTAVMMMILVENNIISLSDSLSNYLPTYSNINPNVTIRQLLNHTSGIADMFNTQAHFDSVAADLTRIWTPQEVLLWVGSPLFEPGAGYGYSNTNYILAGMVAESATGVPMWQLIRDSILNPLQMDSTFFPPYESIIGNVPHPWMNGVDINNNSRNSINTAIGASGAISSTSGEMAHWYNALFSGQVINQTSLSEITNFLSPQNYGMGLQKYNQNNHIEWGHGGINPYGARTRMIYDPCMNAIICGLSNSNNSGIDGQTFILHKVLTLYLPECPGAITGTATVCQGTNNILFTVPSIPNATSYMWTLPSGATGTSSTNSITVDFGVNAISGNITVKGINNYGAGSTSLFGITVNPIPQTPIIIQNGNLLTSNASTGNQWYNSSGLISGATNTTYTITQNDSYYCIVTLQGCNSDTSNVINTLITGLLFYDDNKNLIIFPNPFSMQTVLQTDNELHNATLSVDNIFGQTVTEIKNINGQTVTLHRNALPAGLYFIRLTEDNKQIATKKIVITD